jgi:molybdopterin molybdotransferase
VRKFLIKATQAAGDEPVDIESGDESIEIMTGAALPGTTDTVIPYEHLIVRDGIALVKDSIAVEQHQNIHPKGVDKKQYGVLVAANRYVDSTTINIAAAVGKTMLSVKKLPRVVIISTGDELVGVEETPLPFQVRRSNNYAIQAVLASYGLKPYLLHLPDDHAVIKQHLQTCLDEYDVILLSGGVSMGKFDYVPQVLDELKLVKLFHKVQQRPGKPFWFGAHGGGALVFAFPGNPVATFMCLHRYFVPWLTESLGIIDQKLFAMLDGNVVFTPELQYFLQVKLYVSGNGQLVGEPLAGNGSGDFANLTMATAFMELPANRSEFAKGEIFRVWPFKRVV